MRIIKKQRWIVKCFKTIDAQLQAEFRLHYSDRPLFEVIDSDSALGRNAPMGLPRKITGTSSLK